MLLRKMGSPPSYIPLDENKIVSWIQSWHLNSQEGPLPQRVCVYVFMGWKGGGKTLRKTLASFLLL